MLEIIKGNILEDKDCLYLAHQCNCVSKEAKFLANDIFIKFPFANVYKRRYASTRSTPGTIDVSGDGKKIIAMFAQFYPGPSKWDKDSKQKRKEWFQQCLDEIAKLPDLDKGIAFPWKIGCGAAGGNWTKYHDMIRQFAVDNEKAVVKIIVLPTEKDPPYCSKRKVETYEKTFPTHCLFHPSSLLEEHPRAKEHPFYDKKSRILICNDEEKDAWVTCVGCGGLLLDWWWTSKEHWAQIWCCICHGYPHCQNCQYNLAEDIRHKIRDELEKNDGDFYCEETLSINKK